MYFDWRLFQLTRGVRLRILFAAALGLIAVGAGVARLAVSGVVIYRVITGQAGFSALLLPLVVIAALIVARSVFQYWQNAVSHHTANIVKIRLREQVYEHALLLGPGYADRNRTGDVVLTIVEGIEKLETFFGQYLAQDHRLRHRPSPHLPLHGDCWTRTFALIFLLFRLPRAGGPRHVLPVEPGQQLQAPPVLRRPGFRLPGQRPGAGDAQGVRPEQEPRQDPWPSVRTTSTRAPCAWSAANGATSGASIFFMATGAAIALAVGAVRVSGGDMELRPLLIVLMLGVEVFRPMRELTNLYHQGHDLCSHRPTACSA